MPGLNKIEDYLISLGVSYEEPQAGTWLVEDAGKGLPVILVSIAEPVVILTAKAMRIPAKDREAFFHELLKLNYSGLLHGAYAIEGDDVVLIDTLVYDGQGRVRGLPGRDRLRPLGALSLAFSLYG
jgi:hypothetical protein